MPDIEWNDHGEFVKLAQAIKRSGDARAWRGELRNAVRRSTRPVEKEIRKSARATLPKRGGLGAYIARSTVRTQIVTTGSAADMTIRIVADRKKKKGRVDVKRLNDGKVAHPTYGRKPWSVQGVAPGWFDKPIDKGVLDRVRTELRVVVREMLSRITHAG